MDITRQTVTRKLTVQFDDHTSIDDARELAQRSLDMVEGDDTNLAECRRPDTTDRDEWKKAQERYQNTSLVIVEHDNENYTVWLGEFSTLGITLSPRKAPSNQLTPLCWSERVVVT